MKNLDSYIKLNVVEVKQLQNGIVFTGKIRFRDLNQIFRLTERKENILDPISNTILHVSDDNKEFQRQLSEKKLREIQNYLREELRQRSNEKSLGMFPSSLILYNRLYEIDDLNFQDNEELRDSEDFQLTEDIINQSYTKNLDCCFFLKEEQTDIYKLYIPNNPNTTLIVDGQHRFFGTKLFYSSLLDSTSRDVVENFEFIITFLVGFDIYEVGQIFATVNFNQKPVNRSLYYDIFGASPQTDRDGNLQNDIRLAHDLALHLNNSETSPINSMIKLLGKGYGLFSQAFFVEKMLKVFQTGIWDDYLIDYLNNGSVYKNIAKFMRAYFSAIQEAYPTSWPSKVNKGDTLVYSSYYYHYILCKTTGLGAFFRLIIPIYNKVKSDPDNYKKNILQILKHMSDEDAAKLFSKFGPFGGAGSEGNQDKLYRQLLSKLELDSI